LDLPACTHTVGWFFHTLGLHLHLHWLRCVYYPRFTLQLYVVVPCSSCHTLRWFGTIYRPGHIWFTTHLFPIVTHMPVPRFCWDRPSPGPIVEPWTRCRVDPTRSPAHIQLALYTLRSPDSRIGPHTHWTPTFFGSLDLPLLPLVVWIYTAAVPVRLYVPVWVTCTLFLPSYATRCGSYCWRLDCITHLGTHVYVCSQTPILLLYTHFISHTLDPFVYTFIYVTFHTPSSQFYILLQFRPVVPCWVVPVTVTTQLHLTTRTPLVLEPTFYRYLLY